MYTFCYEVLSPRLQIPNRLSVFSVFNCRYSVFFGIVNTDVAVGVGIGISKYRISAVFRYTDPRLVVTGRGAKQKLKCYLLIERQSRDC